MYDLTSPDACIQWMAYWSRIYVPAWERLLTFSDTYTGSTGRVYEQVLLTVVKKNIRFFCLLSGLICCVKGSITDNKNKFLSFINSFDQFGLNRLMH